MARYVAIRDIIKPRSGYEYVEDRPSPSTIEVIEGDDKPIDTGLYDSNGTPLYRLKERGPCGFTAKSES